MPKKCPVCGAVAIREVGEAVIRCTGIECPAKLVRNIIHFVSKEGMDIDGLGENLVEQFIEKGLIENIAYIYALTFEDIASLKKNGTKFANNLINAIHDSKERPFYKLITALGIRHIGTKSAKTIAKHFKTIENLMNAEVEEIAELEDVGQIMAESIYQFFKQDQTIDLIEKLRDAGVNMKEEQNESEDARFEGLTFVLTGSLENYTREEAGEIIERFGGKVSSSVSKKTSYVLEGEEAGSKLTKAQSLGVKIITENEFEKMIKN